jgi:TP901 family phage tail tape measure protein
MGIIRNLTVQFGANTSVFDKKVKQSSLLTKTFKKNIVGLGKIAATAFAAQKITAFFVSSTKAAIEFETQMARVNTMLGGVSPRALESFSRNITQLSVRYGEATDALASGLYDIVSAGVDANDAIKVLEVSVQAAKAGMISTAISADAITTVLNSYSLEAEEASRVSDVLFSVVKGGKTTFSELANNIGKVASVAAQSGVRLEELGGVIAQLTKSGIRTEQAVTQVNAIIAAISKPSSDAAKAAKKLGIEFDGATLRTKGLLAVLQQLDGVDPDVINRLFPSIEAIKGIAPLIRSLKDLEDQILAVGDSIGETGKQLDIVLSTTQAKIAKAQQRTESWKRSLGQIGAGIVNAIGATQDFSTESLFQLSADTELFPLGGSEIPITEDVEKNIADAKKLLETATALRDEIVRTIKEGTYEAELRAKDLLFDYQTLEHEIRSFLVDDIFSGDVDLGTYSDLAYELRMSADAAGLLGANLEQMRSDNIASRLTGLRDRVVDLGKSAVDTAKKINRELSKPPETLRGVVFKAYKNRLEEVKELSSEIELITGRSVSLFRGGTGGEFGSITSRLINIRGLAGTETIEKESLNELVRIRKAVESQKSVPQLA